MCSQWSTGSPKFKGPESETKMVISEATSGVVVLPIVNCDSVLPTFSFYINKSMVRGLNDRGSQGSFVSERLVSSHNLKVIQDDVKLTINGSNKPQSYLSRVVEVPVCLGKSVHKIPSLVVPEIKVNLNLPQLGSVVEAFLHKGYKLADSNLNENSKSVSNVDFLLGSDAARCLTGVDRCFGRQSLYIEASVGILLLGNTTSILQDLPYLPHYRSLVKENFSATCNVKDPNSQVENVQSYEICTNAFFVSRFIPSFCNNDLENLDYLSVKSNVNMSVLDNKGNLLESQLMKATDQVLENECDKYINYDLKPYNEESDVLHDKLIEFTLGKISRDESGRILVPLLWNGKVSHFLAKNEHLRYQS